jgi:hypothetical protein
MLVTRKSMLTGFSRTLEVPGLTNEMVQNWEEGMLVQEAMPDISPELREFVMTGIAPDEWDSHFPEEEEEEEEEEEDGGLEPLDGDWQRRWCDGQADIQCEEQYTDEDCFNH